MSSAQTSGRWPEGIGNDAPQDSAKVEAGVTTDAGVLTE